MANPIQELIRVRGDILAYNAIMKDVFADELTRLEALNKELDDKLGKVRTLEDAQLTKDRADKYAVDVRAEAEGRAADVATLTEKARVVTLELQDRENAVRQLELDTQTGWNELIAAKDAFQTRTAEINNQIVQEQNALSISAAALQKEREALDAKVAKLAAAVQGV